MPLLIHFGELFLKGRNRGHFERQLLDNLERQLGKTFTHRFRGGRLLVRGVEKSEAIVSILARVFGIANFAWVEVRESTIPAIGEALIELAKNTGGASFKIDTRRAEKAVPFTSRDVNEQVGALLKEKSGACVNLEHPETTYFVEVTKKESYCYVEKFRGAGGLPVGSNGRALAFLSGGIDSPVAAWYILKRGVALDYIHFHSYPQTPRDSMEKAKRLVSILRTWGGGARLLLVPLLPIQKELVKKLSNEEQRYLVLLYRYFMVKIAEEKVRELGAQALVTGDDLGQVASQTIPNLRAIDTAAKLSIFRPLIGFDKEEIIEKAKAIGTYNISIRPAADCCMAFVPKHPETGARYEALIRSAGKVDPSLVGDTIAQTEVVAV